MGKKLYVNNLPSTITFQDLRDTFSKCGNIKSAMISQGRGFVEMSTEDEAAAAILELNGAEFRGRPMMVTLSKPEPVVAPRLRFIGLGSLI
jgi:RNA recognition motif-containing protein